MAFRKKAKFLTEFDADIIIIQESECKEKLNIEDLNAYLPRQRWSLPNAHSINDPLYL